MTFVSEQQALEAIEATFARVDELRKRFAIAHPPAPGSVFDADDSTMPRMRLSELARTSLAQAWDHFDLVKLIIESRRTFVAATGSVLRGALVASAQSLWLVEPDDALQRRERGLFAAQEWYERRIQYQNEMAPDLDAGQLAQSQKQLEMLAQDLAAVSAARGNSNRIYTTDIIREAARTRFGAEHLVRGAVGHWRRLGGDAHAVGWQLMVQAVTWWPSPDPDGLSSATVTGTLSNIAEPYLAAWHMFGAAIIRFDALSASPDQQ